MNRPGYRDDPDEADAEGVPFTEEDWGLYGWADSWRLMVHRIENVLDEQPEVRHLEAVANSFRSFEAPIYAEAELTLEQLAQSTRELRTGDKTRKSPPKRKR